MNVGSPTLWIVAPDGFVRPVPVETGLSDGLMTEFKGGSVQTGDQVVVGVAPQAERDFVSSFVNKVTQGNK